MVTVRVCSKLKKNNNNSRKSVVFSFNVRKNSRYHWAFLTKQLFRSPLLEIIQLSPSGSVNSGGHYASRYIHRPWGGKLIKYVPNQLDKDEKSTFL